LIFFAAWLTGFSIADLVAGPVAGEKNDGWSHATVGILAGLASAGTVAYAAGLSRDDSLWMLAGLVLTSAAWLAIKRRQSHIRKTPNEAAGDDGSGQIAHDAAFGIAIFAASSVAMLIMSDHVAASSSGPLGRFLSGNSITRLASLGVEKACWLLAVGVFFTSPCNSLVRMALESVGTPVAKAQQRLKGGRLIGPLERMLIFGLASAGASTAAALVVSAKGLLRFPELNVIRDQDPSGDTRRIDEVTEYLLVGSLVSWTLALVPLLLAPT
jgi:hypothetical protein